MLERCLKLNEIEMLTNRIITAIILLTVILIAALTYLNKTEVLKQENKIISIVICISIIFLVYQGVTIKNQISRATEAVNSKWTQVYKKQLLYYITAYQLETGKPQVAIPYTLEEEKIKEIKKIASDKGYTLKPGIKITSDGDKLYQQIENELIAVKKGQEKYILTPDFNIISTIPYQEKQSKEELR